MTEDIVSWGVRTHRIAASGASHWRARLREDPTVAQVIQILTPVPGVAALTASAAEWAAAEEDRLYRQVYPGATVQAAVDDVLDEYAHLFPPSG